MNDPNREALDALATRVLRARGEFDARLHESRRRFPDEEFGRLWQAVQEYRTEMKGLDGLHRDVAREIGALREYLELEEFGTPGEVLAMADRMECILLSDYDPYSGGGDAAAFEDSDCEVDDEFGAHEGSCAGCDALRRLDDVGLCRDCRDKLERDLLRKRDWAYSATAFGMTEEQREITRKQVVKQFGEDLELVAVSKDGRSRRKRRKARKSKSRGVSQYGVERDRITHCAASSAAHAKR